MTRAALLLAFAAMLATGCAYPNLQPLVAESAVRWERATGVTDAGPLHVVHRYSRFSCGGKPATGCYHYSSRRLEVDVSRDLESVRATALHEYGHHLGAHHTTTVGAMHPGRHAFLDGRACITQYDVEELCSARECTRRKPECFVTAIQEEEE